MDFLLSSPPNKKKRSKAPYILYLFFSINSLSTKCVIEGYKSGTRLIDCRSKGCGFPVDQRLCGHLASGTAIAGARRYGNSSLFLSFDFILISSFHHCSVCGRSWSHANPRFVLFSLLFFQTKHQWGVSFGRTVWDMLGFSAVFLKGQKTECKRKKKGEKADWLAH